jgi:hypothetical protein
MQINFKHRPDRQYHYESYYTTVSSKFTPLCLWCRQTFGPPGGQWDYHGGWLKLRGEQELMLFKLKWS